MDMLLVKSCTTLLMDSSVTSQSLPGRTCRRLAGADNEVMDVTWEIWDDTRHLTTDAAAKTAELLTYILLFQKSLS